MITSTQRREQFCSNLFVVFDVGVLLSGTFHSACSLILPNTDYGIFFSCLSWCLVLSVALILSVSAEISLTEIQVSEQFKY